MKKPFLFKFFSICQDLCAMKVGTDGVLLGAWAKAQSPSYILDIGTGTGLIALMLAQKYPTATIHAIDIEKEAILQATNNIKTSHWSNITTYLQTIQTWNPQNIQYDLIVSNPPFFTQSLLPTSSKRSLARHDETLSTKELLKHVSQLLKEEGIFAMIFPYDAWQRVEHEAWEYNLYPQEMIKISTTPNKKPKRILFSFGRKRRHTTFQQLYLKDNQGNDSPEYKELCKEYYQDF